MFRSGAVLGGIGAIGYFSFNHFLEENPMTHKKRFILWRSSFDVKLGRFLSKQEKSSYKKANQVISQDSPVHKVTFGIAQELMKHMPKMEPRNWNLTVIEKPQPNAFVSPDGSIFVTTELIRMADNPDQLALVLGHEMGHVYLRHIAHSASTTLSLSIISSLIQFIIFGDSFEAVRGAQNLLLTLPMSREHEYEADKFGVQLSTDTGFDNNKGPGIFSKLQKLEKFKGSEWLSTHPATEGRLKEMKSEIMKLKDVTWPEEQQEKRSRLDYLDAMFLRAKTELKKAKSLEEGKQKDQEDDHND